jgi:hypothetical protein
VAKYAVGKQSSFKIRGAEVDVDTGRSWIDVSPIDEKEKRARQEEVEQRFDIKCVPVEKERCEEVVDGHGPN